MAATELPNPKILGLLRLDWPKSICRAPTVRIGRLPEALQRSVETARSRADQEEERYEKRARRRRGCRGILSLGLGSLRSVGRDQQGRRRLYVGRRRER